MSATNAMMLRRFAAAWQDQMLLQSDEGDGRDGLWLAPIAVAEVASPELILPNTAVAQQFVVLAVEV
ncbi:MAG: hypothetical protein ACKO4X_10885, partial [Alphaproteobacteria bacterium]